MSSKLDKIISDLKDGEIETYVEAFGGFEVLLDIILKKVDIKELLDIDWGVYINSFDLYMLENYKDIFDEYLNEELNDVKIIDGKPYYFSEPSNLASLFCYRDRNCLSQATVESMLEGNVEDYFDHWWNINIHDEVIDELNEKNRNRLLEVMVRELQGKHIDPVTELLESFCEEGEDFCRIDESNVEQVLNDQETFNEMDELDEIRDELKRIYFNSYDSAYHDTLYMDVINELDDYFVMKEKEYKTLTYGTKTREYVQIPIRDFYSKISEWLRDDVGYSESWITNNGSFLSTFLEQSSDCLCVYPPNYPDHKHLKEAINSYFGDYI